MLHVGCDDMCEKILKTPATVHWGNFACNYTSKILLKRVPGLTGNQIEPDLSIQFFCQQIKDQALHM